MENRKNKMHFDLQNVHYAPATIGEDGTFSYGKWKAHKGAMSIDLSPEGDSSTIRADGIDYIVVNNNNGYSGDLNVVSADDEFKRDCVGEVLDEEKNIQYEDADAMTPHFALSFEFKGDVKNKRHVFYNCTCGRPNVTGENKDNQKEPDTDTYSIKASPAVFKIGEEEKHIVKGNSIPETDEEVYKNWFDKVIVPGKEMEE